MSYVRHTPTSIPTLTARSPSYCSSVGIFLANLLQSVEESCKYLVYDWNSSVHDLERGWTRLGKEPAGTFFEYSNSPVLAVF